MMQHSSFTVLLFAAFLALLVLASGGAASALERGTFDRIYVFVFENTGYLKTMRQNFFGGQLKRNAQMLSSYYAVAHPSQPNYVATIAGNTGVQDDDDHDYPANMKTLVDLMEAKGLTWKSYQEDYPEQRTAQDAQFNEQGCFYGHISSNRMYWRKHNPFMSFLNVQQNADRCARIVNARQLMTDISLATQRRDYGLLPHLGYFTPNINNDGHDTGVAYADKYLKEMITPMLSNSFFMNGTLVVVTFDEDDYTEGNRIYFAALGPMAPQGSQDSAKYTHYSLLRTIEDNFGLETLGRNDSLATSFASLRKADKYAKWSWLP